MKEKMIRATGKVFAWGMAVLMIIALVVAMCYAVAFCVGVMAAEIMCEFLGSYILHQVYILAMALCVIGVANMYLSGKHVFVLDLTYRKNRNE